MKNRVIKILWKNLIIHFLYKYNKITLNLVLSLKISNKPYTCIIKKFTIFLLIILN